MSDWEDALERIGTDLHPIDYGLYCYLHDFITTKQAEVDRLKDEVRYRDGMKALENQAEPTEQLEKKVKSLQDECNQFSETWDKQQASIKSLQANLRDEKIKVARLQMIAYGAVDEEYAAYYNLSLQGEPATEKDDE